MPKLSDFPKEQWDEVELQNDVQQWLPRSVWGYWPHDGVYKAEARLVQREALTTSCTTGELRGNEHTVVTTLAEDPYSLTIELPPTWEGKRARVTIRELVDGAEPEMDWRAECESWKRTCDTLKRDQGRMLDEKAAALARVTELESAKATDAAAIEERDRRIADLESELAGVTSERDTLHTQLHEERATCTRQVSALEEKYGRANAYADELEDAIRKCVDAIDTKEHP